MSLSSKFKMIFFIFAVVALLYAAYYIITFVSQEKKREAFANLGDDDDDNNDNNNKKTSDKDKQSSKEKATPSKEEKASTEPDKMNNEKTLETNFNLIKEGVTPLTSKPKETFDKLFEKFENMYKNKDLLFNSLSSTKDFEESVKNGDIEKFIKDYIINKAKAEEFEDNTTADATANAPTPITSIKQDIQEATNVAEMKTLMNKAIQILSEVNNKVNTKTMETYKDPQFDSYFNDKLQTIKNTLLLDGFENKLDYAKF